MYEDLKSNAVKRKVNFIELGVVGNDDGTLTYIGKDVLDKMLPSLIGIPLVDRHQSYSYNDLKNNKTDVNVGGYVYDYGFNENDNMYYVEILVNDNDFIKALDNGEKVSCGYSGDIIEVNETHNNVAYQNKVVDGFFTEIALVDKPRYTNAKKIENCIKELNNSKNKELKGGSKMGFKIFSFPNSKNNKKKKINNETIVEEMPDQETFNEDDLTDQYVEITDDVTGEREVVPLKDVIDTYKAEQVEIAEREKLSKENEMRQNALNKDDTIITLDNGEKVSIVDLKKSYLSKKNKSVENECKNGTEEVVVVEDKKENGDGTYDNPATATDVRKMENEVANNHFVKIQNASISNSSQNREMTTEQRRNYGRKLFNK